MPEHKPAVKQLESIKAFYDQSYHQGARPPTAISKHYRRLAKRLTVGAGEKVLDVACGTGEWLLAVREQGAVVAGIDLSDNATAACRQAMPEGTFIAGQAEALPFPNHSFDLITCLGALEHFVDKPAALSEMRRVGKENSRYLVLVPNAGFLTRRLGIYGGTHQAAIKEDVLSLAEWQALFEAAGFDVRKRWADLHVLSLGWIKRGPWYLWPARAAQALALLAWPLQWQYQVYFLCVARITKLPESTS